MSFVLWNCEVVKKDFVQWQINLSRIYIVVFLRAKSFLSCQQLFGRSLKCSLQWCKNWISIGQWWPIGKEKLLWANQIYSIRLKKVYHDDKSLEFKTSFGALKRDKDFLFPSICFYSSHLNHFGLMPRKIECEPLRAQPQKGNLMRRDPRLLIGCCALVCPLIGWNAEVTLATICVPLSTAHSILHLSSQCIKYSAASNIKQN